MKLAISEICEKFQSGKNILASNIFDDGMYPVFGGNGLRGYANTFNQDGEYAIIGRQGAYCGNVKYHKGKAYLTEHAIIALPKSTHNALYLAYKLKFANLAQYQGQSAQPGLSVSTLSKIKLDMPDYSKQKKIADVLSCIDDKITLNNKTNTELENMAKTIYDYWFTQFDFPDKNGYPYKTSGGQMVYNEILKREIPAGWEVEQLRHYLDCNKNSITKNQKFDYINYLDTGSLTENIITEFQVIKNTDSLPSRAKRIVKKNDILYSSVRPLLKHYGIIKAPKENMIASTGFIILSSKVDSRYNDFFYNYIILESNLNKLVSIAASNVSAYPSINPDDLLDLYIPMPKDFNLLDDFISKIQPIYELINTNQKEAEELTKLRDYLLPLLMNGQIEVR